MSDPKRHAKRSYGMCTLLSHDVSSAMAAKLGRDPTPEELADELGWKMEKVLDVLSAPPEPSSLERPVGSADQDDRAQVGDFLADASPDSSPAERAVERSTPTSCDGPSTGPWPGSSPPSGPP